MDLFTYLLAKNGHNTSIHEDLFSYLLGKSQGGGGEIKTATGVTIYIPDAKKLVSFMMTKESTQETTTGKNLYNLTNLSDIEQSGLKYEKVNNSTIKISGTTSANTSYPGVNSYDLTPMTLNETYTVSFNVSGTYNNMQFIIATYDTNKANAEYLSAEVSPTSYTFTATRNGYIRVYFQINGSGHTQNCLIKVQIEKGSTATAYEEYTGGIPSPNPDYPQEVKTVKGYRNFFDKDNVIGGWISASNDKYWSQGSETFSCTDYIEVKSNTTYIIDFHNATSLSSAGINEYNSSKTWLNIGLKETQQVMTFTTSQNTKYIRFTVRNDSFNYVQLIEGNQLKPYVPYGNNYVNVAVSDGTNTNNYPISLNNNELVGIGDYKDELKVDKSGHVFINKKTGKVVFDGSETEWYKQGSTSLDKYAINFLNSSGTKISNYFTYTTTINQIGKFWFANNVLVFGFGELNTSTLESWKTWLSTHNTEVYYVLETPELIDLQTTVDLKLFKGVNNVSNSVDGYMTIEYR